MGSISRVLVEMPIRIRSPVFSLAGVRTLQSKRIGKLRLRLQKQGSMRSTAKLHGPSYRTVSRDVLATLAGKEIEASLPELPGGKFSKNFKQITENLLVIFEIEID